MEQPELNSRGAPELNSRGAPGAVPLWLLGKLHPRQHHPLPLAPRGRDVFVSAYLALTLQLTPGLLPRHCILVSSHVPSLLVQTKDYT